MGTVLCVSPGGFYGWRRRPPGPRQRRHEALVAGIRALHRQVEARSGSPRIRAELVARGVPCRLNIVARRMRRHGVAAGRGRRFRCTTDPSRDRPAAEDVPGRRFEPGAADRAWAAGITHAPTGEGWPYQAAVEDPRPRRIGGWSMSERVDSRLVVDAPELAIARRLPEAGPAAHADRGSQYAREHHRRILAGRGLARSMSRRGDCWDNTPLESFFAGPKKELIHGADHATREEARASIFEYIEVFDNRVRRHSSLGYQSPDQFERAG